MAIVFSKLHLNPLHMACEERDAREDVEPTPRIASSFVIEKLLQVGVSLSNKDENGNPKNYINF